MNRGNHDYTLKQLGLARRGQQTVFETQARQVLVSMKAPIPRRVRTGTLSPVPPWSNFPSFISVNTPCRTAYHGQETANKAMMQEDLNANYSGFAQIFTDGSKLSSGSTAASLFVPSLTQAVGWKLNPAHTALGAELFGIHQALTFANEHPALHNKDIVILSDSQSALHLLKNIWNPNYRHIVYDIQKLASQRQQVSKEIGGTMKAYFTVVVLSLVSSIQALENGLARTPPMGWLAWERFRCNTDCTNDPYNCISETLFMQMADIMVAEGYLEAGYNMVSLDDCWLDRDRDSLGRLQPDFTRFPSGIPALADYMHSRGLKFGIYEDYGNYTCAGYPGILGHLQIDAQTFADWQVDYVKLDGCYSLPTDMDTGYPLFGYYLNQTGRSIVYSCSWPVYQIYAGMQVNLAVIPMHIFKGYPEFGLFLNKTGRLILYECSWPFSQLRKGMQPNWTSIINTCNLWRNFDDIQDSWDSVQRIIDYYGDNQDDIVPNAGPGHWNDPDMLIIGNFGLSYEQSKSQMAMWAIFAAPLLMSVDLRTIKADYKAILLNTAVIAVNQDPLGIQGRRIYKDKGIEIWARPISPVEQDFYSYAIAFLNRRTDGTPSEVSVTLAELGLTYPGGYSITDLFDGVNYGVVEPSKRFKVDVNPSGVVLVRCDLAPSFRRHSNVFPSSSNQIGSFHNLAVPGVTRRVNPLTNDVFGAPRPGHTFPGRR
ncbi:Glycoside hydrolase family 27 [Trinorchestia longiramus]|nr:Glycoside hydrolase family 27 [Trinorchestia longiramus]